MKNALGKKAMNIVRRFGDAGWFSPNVLELISGIVLKIVPRLALRISFP
jgi:hypothetical protein